jgi:hypothetical protein
MISNPFSRLEAIFLLLVATKIAFNSWKTVAEADLDSSG